VFLEPRNPWYSEGRSYYFEIAGTDVRTDSTGNYHDVVVVIDKMGNRISIPRDNSIPFPSAGKKIKLTIERITKGKVHLIPISNSKNYNGLKAGSKYEFIIERIERGMDDEEYFVVTDPLGNLHTIARAYYEYYGYTVGARFRGKVISYRKNGEKNIEPENPFYKPGSVVRMDVTGFTKNIINPSFTMQLKDKFGFTHYIETPAHPVVKSVRCRIVMIKKGKPLLELL
jgi:hypothetical protein